MDNAVALVRAYLHVNGYFTVCEYPVLEAAGHGGYRTVTDLDVLAVRFPHAGRLVTGLSDHGASATGRFEPDPMLGVPGNVGDMVIGEVKEGRARLNEPTTDPAVLEAALVRFGCCRAEEAAGLARTVLHGGDATGSHGHRVRLVVFASFAESTTQAGVRVIPLGQNRALFDGLHRTGVGRAAPCPVQRPGVRFPDDAAKSPAASCAIC